MERTCKSCSSSKIVVFDHQCVCEECGVILEDQVTAIVPFSGYAGEHDQSESRVFIPLSSRYECECPAADRIDTTNGSPSKHRPAQDFSANDTVARRMLLRRPGRKRISTTRQQIEALLNSCVKQLQLGEKVHQSALSYFHKVRCHPSVSNSVGELQAAYAIACVSCASRAAKTPVTFASLRTFLESAKQVRSFKRIIEHTKRLLWNNSDTPLSEPVANSSSTGLLVTKPELPSESPFALRSNDLFENLLERARLSKPVVERAREIWSLVKLALRRSYSPELVSLITIYLADLEATARQPDTASTAGREQRTQRTESSTCSFTALCRFSVDKLALRLPSGQLRNCFTQLTERWFNLVRLHLPNLLPAGEGEGNSDCATAAGKAEFTRRLHLYLRDLSAFSSVLFADAHDDTEDESDSDSESEPTNRNVKVRWSAPPHKSVLDPTENEHDVPISQFDNELDSYIRSPPSRLSRASESDSMSVASSSTDISSP